MKKEFRTNAGDAACNHLHCGDNVRLTWDERHTGSVLWITGGLATVRWHDTNWLTEVFPHDLKKIRVEDL